MLLNLPWYNVSTFTEMAMKEKRKANEVPLLSKAFSFFILTSLSLQGRVWPEIYSVAQGIFWLFSESLSRSTLHLLEGERRVCALVLCCVLCCLATVLFLIDPSVTIVTRSPKIGPLLLFSFSVGLTVKKSLLFLHPDHVVDDAHAGYPGRLPQLAEDRLLQAGRIHELHRQTGGYQANQHT